MADPPAATVAELVLRRAGDGRTGLVFEGRTWTWDEVVDESRRYGEALLTRRQPGPFHVGVLLENVPEYVFLLLGAALCGAVVVGVNPTRRGSELAADIAHTDCQLLVTDAAGAELVSGLDLGPAVVLEVGSPGWLSFLAGGRPRGGTEPAAGDLYALLFTSGSTGAPKAVRLSQGRAARTAADSAAAFGPDDVLYCAMPLFHGNALLANLLAGLVAGSTVALRRRFSASAFLPDVREVGATFFNYVGRTLSYILAVPETPVDADNRLKWAVGSEAAVSDRREFTRRFGCYIYEGYGSSENAVVIVPGRGMPDGAMGRPRAGTEAAVYDRDTGRECPPAAFDADGRLLNAEEAIGEIVGLDGADRFEGYYNNPEAERERLAGRWYWTGDLGYRDGDGWFYFAGRTLDWLRVDGENFAAGPVERILERYPGFRGVAVYGVPDPVTGDQVMAAVETDGGAGFRPDDFTAFLAAQPDLGTKWAPRFVAEVTELPLTGSGKVDKKTLRQRQWQGRVWWRGWERAPAGSRLMTDDDRAGMAERFSANRRDHLLSRVTD